MQSNIRILSTRPLDERLIKAAMDKGISIDVSAFIETAPIESVEVQQEVELVLNAAATVIFTSMNAVEAVEQNRIDEQPQWIIYCIGNTTRKLVEKYFPFSTIAGTADDALLLAELIIEEAVSTEVVFFCGDQRRDELPRLLSDHDINVNEIVTYQTTALPHKVQEAYNAILFFSPSAVDSFFVKNKLLPATILFAIGRTTAAAIKKFSDNKIIIPDSPGKESLYEKVMEYFT